jgi:hypothetical protein
MCLFCLLRKVTLYPYLLLCLTYFMLMILVIEPIPRSPPPLEVVVPATPSLPGVAPAPDMLNAPNLQLALALSATPAAATAPHQIPDAHDGSFPFGLSREAFAAALGLAGIRVPANKLPRVSTRPADLLPAVISAAAPATAPGRASVFASLASARPPAASSCSFPVVAAAGAASGAGEKRKGDCELSQSSSAKRSRTYCASWDDKKKDKERFHGAYRKAKNAALSLLKKEEKWKNASPEHKKELEKAAVDQLMAKR